MRSFSRFCGTTKGERLLTFYYLNANIKWANTSLRFIPKALSFNAMLKPQVELVHCTDYAETLITEMARVSAPKNKRNWETGPKLIKYLIKNKHWSPFEMASMCVSIHTTRAISSQILRHRSFSFQEFSQRYADAGVIGNPRLPQLRRQDTKNRQNSIDDLDPKLIANYNRRISLIYEDACHLYQEMLSQGVAKECARYVLPIASPTELYMHGTIRSWIHYLELRCDSSTQLEHRDIATEIKEIFIEKFPIISEALWKIKPIEKVEDVSTTVPNYPGMSEFSAKTDEAFSVETDEAIQGYFECLTECKESTDPAEASCKSICKEVLIDLS